MSSSRTLLHFACRSNICDLLFSSSLCVWEIPSGTLSWALARGFPFWDTQRAPGPCRLPVLLNQRSFSCRYLIPSSLTCPLHSFFRPPSSSFHHLYSLPIIQGSIKPKESIPCRVQNPRGMLCFRRYWKVRTILECSWCFCMSCLHAHPTLSKPKPTEARCCCLLQPGSLVLLVQAVITVV